MPAERVTVTLPADVLEAIDRAERNRSRFVLDAVRRELARRKREELRRSLRSPHPEAIELAETGLAEWASFAGSGSELLDEKKGTAIRWTSGKGWVKSRR